MSQDLEKFGMPEEELFAQLTKVSAKESLIHLWRSGNKPSIKEILHILVRKESAPKNSPLALTPFLFFFSKTL